MTERKKVLIDSALKNKLLGAMPFSSEGVHEYTPRYFKRRDRNGDLIVPETAELEDGRTIKLHPVYYVSSLSTAELESAKQLNVRLKKAGGDDMEEDIYKTVARHLKRWDNVIDLGAEEYVDHETDGNGGTKMSALRRIPSTTVGELFMAVLQISGLTDMDKLSLMY